MALTGTSISGKIKLLLQDETSIRWTEAELLGWINSALNEIVLHKPNACVKNKAITMVAGSKQSIATGDIQLIDIIRNVGGGAITPVNRNVLDVTIPSWHTSAGAASAKHYCFNPKDPKTFYVYPPSTGVSHAVEATVATVPAALAALGSTIDLDDVYEAPITDYVMYRAFSKDSEHTANMQRAAQHYQAFIASMNGKLQGEVVFAPKQMFADGQLQPQR